MQDLIEGKIVRLGTTDYVVPALNFKRIKQLKEDLQHLSMADPKGALDETQVEASITIIHSALTRNYPDLTRDDVEDLVDLKNLAEIMSAIMGQSGLVKSGETAARIAAE